MATLNKDKVTAIGAELGIPSDMNIPQTLSTALELLGVLLGHAGGVCATEASATKALAAEMAEEVVVEAAGMAAVSAEVSEADAGMVAVTAEVSDADAGMVAVTAEVSDADATVSGADANAAAEVLLEPGPHDYSKRRTAAYFDVRTPAHKAQSNPSQSSPKQ